MSKTVISLEGSYRDEPASGNATVIAELERLLTAAKSGKILVIAGSYVHRRVVTWSSAGAVSSDGVFGGLDCAKEKLVRLALAGS